MPIILSLDPSLTAFGWALLNDDKLIDGGCWETKPIKGLVSNSDYLRVSYIASSLQAIIDKYKPDLVVSESPAGSKSSQAIKALSLVKGMLIGLHITNKFKLEWISARNAKLATTLNPAASKKDILNKINEKYVEFDTLFGKKKLVIRYAVADAISVFLGRK